MSVIEMLAVALAVICALQSVGIWYVATVSARDIARVIEAHSEEREMWFAVYAKLSHQEKTK